jgi:flagellar motor protein MotB
MADAAAHAEEKKPGEAAAAHGGGDSHGGGGHGGGHGGGGHGGGGHEEGHEGAPEWLISFADNVALLMGFFVILLAMNMGPKAEPVQGGAKGEHGAGFPSDPAMEAIIGIREAFHTPLDPLDPDDAKVLRYKMMKDSGQANEPGVPGTFTNVQALENHNFKNITGSVIFDNNSALVSPSARKTIAEVAARLRDQRWIIDVRGNVSPFESMRDNTKAMNLSHERAMAVAQAMIEAGLKWENLRIVACGSNDRVVARAFDAQEDRSNQRVEIVVTNETIPADPYAHDGGSKGSPESPASPTPPTPASAPSSPDNNPGER